MRYHLPQGAKYVYRSAAFSISAHPLSVPFPLRSCIGNQRAEGRGLHSGSNRPLAVPPLRGQPWGELVDDVTWSSRAGDHAGLALKL